MAGADHYASKNCKIKQCSGEGPALALGQFSPDVQLQIIRNRLWCDSGRNAMNCPGRRRPHGLAGATATCGQDTDDGRPELAARRPERPHRRHGARGPGGAARRVRRLPRLRRPGGDRLDRLHGPRQFRDQHPGRREIRLRPAVGGAAREFDRDAVPGAVGQARHRHRAQPRGNVPRAISPSRWSARCGSSARSPPWRPISPNSSAAPSGCRCCSTCRCMAGMGVTAVVTYGILMFQGRGFRPVEIIIGELRRADRALLSRRNVHRAGRLGARPRAARVIPQIPDAGALLLAVGIIGATVMPHAVYLHSGLTQGRVAGARRPRAAHGGAHSRTARC